MRSMAASPALSPLAQRRTFLNKLGDKRKSQRVAALSFAQARLWILDRFQPGNPTYNIPTAMRLQGFIDVFALERALNEIVRRHEALRTTFELIDGKPAQVIAPSLQIKLRSVDLRFISKEQKDTEVSRIVFEESRTSFDLSKGPMLRASLLKVSNVDHVLILVMHHIVSDGWSMSVLHQELSTLYMAFLQGRPSPLPELPIQYADFAEWQAEWLQGEVIQEHFSYWSKQLAGLRPILDLATDHPRPPVQTNRGDIRGFSVGRQLCEDLKALSRAHGATLFMVLIAAFKTLLHRLSGETDIALGSPIANRMQSELEGLIGFFVNTLVLRTDLSGDPTFVELLAREREVALGAYAHQDMPFEKLVEELKLERNLAHNPLFQILFAVQNIGIIDRNAPRQSGVQPPAVGNGTAKFDLTMSLMDTGSGAQGFLEFNTDLFKASTAEVLIERYLTILNGIAENPDSHLSELPITTTIEREQPLEGLIGPVVDSTLFKMPTVDNVLAMRAAVAPDSLAVVSGEGIEINYGELNIRANRLARRLRLLGALPERSIALAMPRGIHEVIAIAGILKAGCSYIPLDTSEPVARLQKILEGITPMMIIAEEQILRKIDSTVPMFTYDQLTTESLQENGSDLDTQTTPDSVAVLVVVNDANGCPSTVAITHRALFRSASDPAVRLDAADRVARLSHVASDAARFEVFGAFAAGATIVCMPDDMPAASRKYATFLRDMNVTAMFMSVAIIERLAREFPWALRKIRLLISEERFTDATLIREFFKPEVLRRIVSLYGDPNAGGYFAVQPWSSIPGSAEIIPIGRPAPGVTIWLLDSRLEPVPPGIIGEIHIESDDLVRGSKSQTAACVSTPLSHPSATLLYATGDLALRLPDGTLEFRGRRDGRLMAGGLSVYPLEIESALLEYPKILDAGVSSRQRHGLRDRGLAAFITLAENTFSEDDLRVFLATRLPNALIPTAYKNLARIPRRTNEQVDRRALADAVLDLDAVKTTSEPYVPPQTEIEIALVQIWMDTLGTERIGIKDDFFRLGGHSLLATQVVARIGDAFQIDFPLQSLFQAPTIEQLARKLEPIVGSDAKPDLMNINHVPRDRPIPLSFAQQRLWFLDQFEPNSAFYNIAIPWHIPGAIDAPALELAFNGVIERHEALRTTFDMIDGQPVQIVAPAYKLSMPINDLRSLPERERTMEMRRLSGLEALTPFDLKNGPVLRARLIRLADNDHLLLLTIHHIAADGWSTEIFLRELITLYEARLARRSANLPDLKIQYADFAFWQRRWLTGAVLERQLAYWKQQLKDAPALLELPMDRPRPRVQTFSGDMYRFSMPGTLLQSLKIISDQEQVTLFTTLLAGFMVLLHRYTGREDLVVGTPIANRVRPELEQLIGFFANTLVLRTQVQGSLTFRQLLAREREVTLGAYAHQDIPFEKLVEEFQPERNLSYNPLFQVMFALQNTGRPAVVSANAQRQEDDVVTVIGAGVAKFDLTVFVSETTSGIQAGIEYNSDLFDRSTVVRLAAHYETILTAAAADLNRPIWALPMLSPAESMSLAEWNDTTAPLEPKCIHQMFEAQAATTPHAVAVAFNGQSISYQELNQRANYWANQLLTFGIGMETCVGISMERSPEIIVAVLAVLKAGASYVPIDPNYPKDRVAFMLYDSRAPLVLTQHRLRGRLPDTKAIVLTLDEDRSDMLQDDAPAVLVNPDNIAFVIYTSGSTGEPKGVAMAHTPLANLIQWQIKRSNLPYGARTLQFASLSFDVSFQEIFSTLCAGGTLVLITENERRDPEMLWSVIRCEEICRLFLPYVALQQLAEQANKIVELPSNLKEIITAGEQLQITPQIATLFHRLNATLYNQYGPTESHVVTELKLTGSPSEWPPRPSIGRPIPNATIHILDSYGQPCAIGTPGELCIGGAALARGYIHRENLTAQRFIPDVQGVAGTRLYLTGDRARYLSDGTIQFLGRLDDQVKVRGFRIEPGEIEIALRKYPTVREAVVIAQERTFGEIRLSAYVQADIRNAPTVQELRTHLASLLPEYMIPSAFVIMPSLPLTPSGKLNRRALQDHFEPISPESTTTIPPRTSVEESLAKIWRDVLQLQQIGIQDNFFELGGHSLLATRVISRIKDEFDVELPVRVMFEASTIEALALAVVASALGTETEDETARLLNEIEQMPDEVARTLLSENN